MKNCAVSGFSWVVNGDGSHVHLQNGHIRKFIHKQKINTGSWVKIFCSDLKEETVVAIIQMNQNNKEVQNVYCISNPTWKKVSSQISEVTS